MNKSLEVSTLEHKLKQSEERLDRIIHLNNQGVVVFKPNKDNIYAIKESIDDIIHVIKKVNVYVRPKDILDISDVVSISLSENKFIFRVEGAERGIFFRSKMFEVEIHLNIKTKTLIIYDEYLAHHM